MDVIGYENLVVSDVTRAELFYGAFNKIELQKIRKDLNKIPVLHIDQSISKMAVDLVEKYCLSHRTDIQDALIAATSISYCIELYTLNVKDFVFIPEIKLYQPTNKEIKRKTIQNALTANERFHASGGVNPQTVL
jgi:predicted nucleic acid-binding protein